MPRNFTINNVQRIVVSRYAGVMTYRDVIRQWAEIRIHPEYDPSFNYVTDLTGVTEYKITSDEIHQLVNIHDPFGPTSKRIVVAPTDLLFGMVRMYEMSGQLHPGLHAVRAMDEARQILDF